MTSYEDFFAEHRDMFNHGRITKFPSAEAINWATEHGKRFMFIEDTKLKQHRFGGEYRRYWNIGLNGTGVPSTFSMRPGWHAGSLPTMRQIGKGKSKDLRDDRFVWTEGEMAADVDYNEEASKNPDNDLPDKMPEDGYYLKATNANNAKSQADRVGWYVGGSFKANRIISDSEAHAVIDKWNEQHKDKPVEYDFERESGKVFNADTMQLEDADGIKQSLREEKEEGLDMPFSEKRLEEMNKMGQTVKGGVAMSKRAAIVKDDTGYKTPLEKGEFDDDAIKFSVKTLPQTIDYFKSQEDATRSTIASLENWMVRTSLMDDTMERISPFLDKMEKKGKSSLKNSPIRPQGDIYKFTFDVDTSCPRTFINLSCVKEAERRLGRPLTLKEAVQMNEHLRAYGLEIPCVYCYVENKRQALKDAMFTFIDAYNGVMRAKDETEARKVMYGKNGTKANPLRLTDERLHEPHGAVCQRPSLVEDRTTTDRFLGSLGAIYSNK